MVIDPEGPQAHLAEGTGTAAVRALVEVLSTRWPDVTGDDTVALISYAGEDVASYEVAPAFATETGFRIPNGVEWMDTNPHEHARMVTEKNADCDGKFVPLVKMNRPGFDAAPFLEKDADHAQALPHRAA